MNDCNNNVTNYINIVNVLFYQNVLAGAEGAFLSNTNTGLNFRNFQWPMEQQTLENFLLGIFVPLDFAPEVSGIFAWMLRISEIQQFSEIPEIFLQYFRSICSRFQRCRIFGRMESTLILYALHFAVVELVTKQ